MNQTSEQCDGTDDAACPGECQTDCECPVGPVTEDLSPCFRGDFWEFDVMAGQIVFLEADTVDAATAADLCFSGNCPSVSFFGDDDFACTFPPPEFSCPRDAFVAITSGTCIVELTTC